VSPRKLKLGRLLLIGSVWSATLLIAASGGFLAGKANVPPLYERVLVARVIDGDTIELADGRRVRYIGIDTPETVHPTKGQECYGPEATARNQQLVEGKTVELQSGIEDKDEYGRLLRYVYVDGVFVNAQLVAEGYAYASSFGAEGRYRQVFVQLQQYGKLKGRGLWSACPQSYAPWVLPFPYSLRE